MMAAMNTRTNVQNYYQILEVPPTAQHQEVVAAYQRAKEAYAPDSPALYTMFSKEEANELRNLIEEAFQVIGNQKRRREYDLTLANQASNYNAPTSAPAAPVTNTSTAQKTENFSNRSLSQPNKSGSTGYSVDEAFEKEILARTDFDGPFLKKVRTYKNINLEQIVKETRISRSYLTAIEADDFSSLPAPVFLRGFVIQFAKQLGLNTTLVASSYMARIKKDN